MSIAKLADTCLPFNRKERYFTGTVLPMIVCAENFAHFHRLTELAGLGPITVDPRPGSANVQFFTEYGFAESVVGSAKERFSSAPTTRDTPDVMIYIAGPRPAMLALEAKMYDRPSTADLQAQLSAQAALVSYLADRLRVEAPRIAHRALLPARFAGTLGPLLVPIITWEQILETFADVAPPYFLEMLRVALARYDELVAPRTLTFEANAEFKLTGAEIQRQYAEGRISAAWMGRRGGLNGPELANDLATGKWITFRYECSSKPVRNANWFPITAFIARINARPQPPPMPTS
jgi:hypothetical protein